MALVITLAILALLSILLVAFVSTAALDRGSTKSYAESLQADQVAQGGLDQIVAQFQAEMADPKLSTNSVPTGASALYVPLANTNAVPQRTAPVLANLATLLSYSGTNLYTAGSGTPNYASSSLTTSASLNGRIISVARWSKPQLMTTTNGFTVPQWILMTRAGPQAFTTYNSLVANSSTTNSSFAIGRYAYVVYDTSGLLDANVAGYLSGASASAAGKGLMPWADLTQVNGTVSQTPDIDNLVNWRNNSTASPASGYAANVYFAATNNGFTRVAIGDTTFLSRQELIKYAQTQNHDLTNALPYLTTFSRELNGPTWGPTTPAGSTTNYALAQYAVGSFNPRIPNPRVQAAFTRNNGLPAVAGEPLVKYRFPLDKLALLEKLNGSTLSAADLLSVQKYFGMDPAADSNGPSFRHWNYPTTNTAYVHNAGTSGATGIMSLDDVAAQNREPDFFELLQAGMLSGSLGAPGTGNKGRPDQTPANGNVIPSFVDPDDKVTLQIFRIGANIIDQWDADSFPTTISYTPNGGLATSVEGIEDLPYPFAAYLNMYAANSGVTGTSSIPTPLPPFEYYLYFALWNPHQTPASFNAANYPTALRFSPYYNNSTPANSDSFLAGFINSKVISSVGPPITYVGAAWFYYGPSTAPNTKNGVANAHSSFYLTNIATSTGTPSGTYTGIPFTYSPSTTAYREPALAAGSPTPPTATVPSPWNNIACLALPQLTNFPAANAAANQGGSTPFPAECLGPERSGFRLAMPILF